MIVSVLNSNQRQKHNGHECMRKRLRAALERLGFQGWRFLLNCLCWRNNRHSVQAFFLSSFRVMVINLLARGLALVWDLFFVKFYWNRLSTSFAYHLWLLLKYHGRTAAWSAKPGILTLACALCFGESIMFLICKIKRTIVALHVF